MLTRLLLVTAGLAVAVPEHTSITKSHYEKADASSSSPGLAIDTYRRGKQRVLVERMQRSGDRRSIVRVFYVKEVESIMEADTNGDGVWERLTFYGKDGNVLEVFERESAANVRPVDSDVLGKRQKEAESWQRFWEK
jgi:hypothetical protein